MSSYRIPKYNTILYNPMQKN